MSTPIATPPGKHGYRTRDESIRPIAEQDELILSHRKLVWQIYHSKKHCRIMANFSEEDAVSAGTLGLIRAAEKYREEYGYAFGTYAGWWIWADMRRAAFNSICLIHIPYDVQDDTREILPHLREAARRVLEVIPLDLFNTRDEEHFDSELAIMEDPEPSFFLDEELQRVHSALDCVPESCREPFLWYYRDGMLLHEIGSLLGITGEAARLRVARAAGMLRDRLGLKVAPTPLRVKRKESVQ